MKKHLQLLRHGVGNMHSMELTAKPGARHWIWGVGGGRPRTHGDTEHSGVATAGGPAGTWCLVPTSEFKKGGRGEEPSKCRQQSHDCTLLKPEGFMRALAITTTICCAG